MAENRKLNIPVNPTYREVVVNSSAKEWELEKGPEYREYRRKWKENPKSFQLGRGPIHLDIEPTNACNLRCPMCPRTVLLESSPEKLRLGFMDVEAYKAVIDEAIELGVSSVKLNWLGEPLLHPRIVEMVAYAKEKGIVDVMFNTNAVLLTEELAASLMEAGLDKIFFSFDSPYKEQYESIRVGANYEDTLQNIQMLKQLKAKKGSKSPLTRVSMVLMQENANALQDFINLFRDIVDIVAYVDYRDPVVENTAPTDFGGAMHGYEAFACSQLWQRMIISWDGDVMVCCLDSSRNFVMGNVNQNSIGEIWQNDRYRFIRECHKNGKYFLINMCRNCPLVLRKEDGSI